MVICKSFNYRSFNAISYSADGTWLLAGGKSVNLCMYSAEHQVIAHKLTLTKNRSLDGLPVIDFPSTHAIFKITYNNPTPTFILCLVDPDSR